MQTVPLAAPHTAEYKHPQASRIRQLSLNIDLGYGNLRHLLLGIVRVTSTHLIALHTKSIPVPIKNKFVKFVFLLFVC